MAHPDDETFCSGLISELVNHGVEVRLLCLTRGEGGPTGGLPRSELGPAREQEMRSSCQKLGIGEVRFLEHVDPLARAYRVFAPKIRPRDLAKQIETELSGADLILSHGSSGEYWHPAHLLVFDAVKRCLRQNPSPPQWLTFLARQPDHEIPRLINWDDEADFSLDVSASREIREKALACHQTQLGLFAKFGGGDYRDFIRKTCLETYHRFCD